MWKSLELGLNPEQSSDAARVYLSKGAIEIKIVHFNLKESTHLRIKPNYLGSFRIHPPSQAPARKMTGTEKDAD